MANALIVAELETPASWGLNSVTRTYTNPGGADRDVSITAIESNAALFNLANVQQYISNLDPPTRIYEALTATGLQDLSAQERADWSAFIGPLMSNGPITNPNGLLKGLIDSVIFSGSTGDNPTIRSNFDALIKENVSIAQIMGVNVTASVVEQAMFELGWIV